MEVDYHKENIDTYKKKFEAGYGLEYPEPHIVRFFHHVLKERGLVQGNVLDVGCGNGVHSRLFESLGFNAYGFDTNGLAVETANRLSKIRNEKRFVVSSAVPVLEEMFPGIKFDVVIANQVIYYLENADIAKTIQQIFKACNPGAVFFASMISPDHYYFDHSSTVKGTRFRKVVLSGRLEEIQFINFKQSWELENLFKPFSVMHVGRYGYLLREDEGYTGHVTFIGEKQG